MRLPKAFYRLPLRFDAERMRAEVEALPVAAWVEHPNRIEGNSSLRLITVHGGENDDLRGPMQMTAHLQASPYLRQVLASFGVVWSRSRLMRLSPGAQVPEHADASYHWFNRVRLHLPIVTRPEVSFQCDGTSVHMAAGEAWLFDNWRRHSVDNGSAAERIHLVADTTGTAAFWRYVVASETATGDKFIPFRPEVDARPVMERTVPRPVMPPAEVELLLTDFIGELVASDEVSEGAQNLARYVGALNGFCCDWRQLYLLHGENPAAAERYANVLRDVRESTKPIAHGLVMQTNQSPAQAVLESRLLQHVLRPDEMRSDPAARPLASTARRSVGNDPVPERPVFIVAAPRSGSTLLFETLAVSPQVCTLGGEAHWLIEQIEALRPGAPGVDSNRLEADKATRDVAEQIVASLWPRMVDSQRRRIDVTAARRLRWLEKTPKNSLRIPFLDRLFPDARFVFLWRDPRENVSSIIDAWRAGGWVTYPQLPGWDGPWSMILPPGWQALRGRPLEEVAAFQWKRTNSIILRDLRGMARDRWTTLSYGDFLADRVETVRRLCGFAGLEFDAPMAARVAGPLPLSRHTLSPPEDGKWRRNETGLKRTMPGLDSTWRRLRELPSLIPAAHATTHAESSAPQAARRQAYSPKR